MTQLADLIVAGIRPRLSLFKIEEDLRIAFEKVNEPMSRELGISSEPKYKKSIYHGRSDALHGWMVIKYEPPRAFGTDKNMRHAFEQLVRYIQDLSVETRETLFLFGTKFVGVGFDDEKIFFVSYVGDKKPETELNENYFTIRGSCDFTPESARTLLIHLRTLILPPLAAEDLTDRFGPKSDRAIKAVSAFEGSLENWSGTVSFEGTIT